MNQQIKNSELSELFYFLEQPESYPHQVDEVQHIQTHISHVFIAGSFVYKLKKPVNFDFLDYSTLEKRKELCYKEVELNRRLSDDIYLGVIGFAKKDETYLFEEGHSDSSSIVEYAVKMNRLPDEHFLIRYVENNGLTREHLDRVADTLAEFYRNQNQRSELSKWGEIETIKVNTDENFEQTEPFIDQTIDLNSFDAIRYFTDQCFQKKGQLFQDRIKDGKIVDGHGDLHLEHIHITPEKVQIYDCIEFNERFRYGDVAADLAYLAMDLDFNDCQQEERYFVNQMSKKLADKDLLQILDFYKCYRAYVKGKVKSLQSSEEEVSKKDRESAANRAKEYFKLSLRYALVGSGPVVIILMGRIGTGKSTLAGLLASHLNIEQYSSDTIRKSLAGLPLTERTPPARRESLYSAGMSSKTYDRLIKKALESIKDGKAVIIDATFSHQQIRQKLITAIKSEAAPYLFVEAQASDETIINRLHERKGKTGIISDARLEDFEKLTESYEIPSELENGHFVTVDTNQSPSDSLEELFKQMIDLNVSM